MARSASAGKGGRAFASKNFFTGASRSAPPELKAINLYRARKRRPEAALEEEKERLPGCAPPPSDGTLAGAMAVSAGISVGLFLRQQIAPGETLTTEKDGTAPKVLSCAGSKGEIHYYIEAAAVAELFDVTDGVTFRIDETKPLEDQLELCAKPLGEGGVSLKLTNEQYRSGQ